MPTPVIAAVLIASTWPASPSVHYEMSFSLACPSPHLRVTMTAAGLAPLDRLTLQLPNHGEWTEVDTPYLRDLAANVPLRRHRPEADTWDADLPTLWNGNLSVRYTIPLVNRASPQHQRHGLLPWFVADEEGSVETALALSTNTLMRVLGDGPIACSVHILAEPGLAIGTGWQGVDNREQRVELPDGVSATPILVGSPRVLRECVAGTKIEIAQFTPGEEISHEVMAIVRAVLPAYMADTGRAFDRPFRIFIVEKGGGQWFDHAMLLQGATREEACHAGYQLLVAHELFHQWLGGYARPATPSLVWFFEGFTDYLACFYLAQQHRVSREWFLSRMLEVEAAAVTSSAAGKVALGDPDVVWRDHDGPYETLAYRGGTLLAFCLDAELHRREKPRLGQLVGRLCAEPGGMYSLQSIRAWCEEQGVSGFFETHVLGRRLPPLHGALESAGFQRANTSLTYLGIRLREGPGLGEVVALDPQGPASLAGLEVGDVVTGYWPVRSLRPTADIDQEAYPWGLEIFDPGATVVHVGVQRRGEDHTLAVRPGLRGEGMVWGLAPAPTSFFSTSAGAARCP